MGITEWQLLSNAQHYLHRVEMEVLKAQNVMFGEKPNYNDSVDILDVVHVIDDELTRMIAVARRNWTNPQNVRLAEDFALKAKLAKARSAVASALKDVKDGTSHK